MSMSPDSTMRGTDPHSATNAQSSEHDTSNIITSQPASINAAKLYAHSSRPQSKRVWKASVPESDTHTQAERDTAEAMMHLRYPEQAQGPLASPLTLPDRSNEEDVAAFQFPSTKSAHGLPPPNESQINSVPQESANYTQPGYESEAVEDAEVLMLMVSSQPGGSAENQNGEVPFQTEHTYGPPEDEIKDKTIEARVVGEAEKEEGSELSVEQRRRLISSGATKRGKDYFY